MHLLALVPKKYYLYAALIVIVSGLVLVMGVFTALVGSDGDQQSEYSVVFNPNGLLLGTKPLPSLVEGYRDEVEQETKANGIYEYTDLILALMAQESGGRGADPMQASESLCGYIGCIKSPEASITQGVKYFKQVMQNADHDVLLALQSYNFGGGFIGYAKQHNDGKYSKELAIEFSQMMYQRLKHTGNFSCIRGDSVPTGACYGDVLYVDVVLTYYHPKSVAALDSIPIGGSSDAVVNATGKLKTVLEEAYKYEGMGYVFGGNGPSPELGGGFDCSSLMQWTFGKAGITLPRTANAQYNASTKISREDLRPGDLVFFTGTYNAGVPVTHVGIYIGDGMMYDANGSGVGETNLNDPYWQAHLYGYGRIANF